MGLGTVEFYTLFFGGGGRGNLFMHLKQNLEKDTQCYSNGGGLGRLCYFINLCLEVVIFCF